MLAFSLAFTKMDGVCVSAKFGGDFRRLERELQMSRPGGLVKENSQILIADPRLEMAVSDCKQTEMIFSNRLKMGGDALPFPISNPCPGWPA